jgi:ribosomal protein S18 acetylase RimI-like enzyme
MLSPDTAAPASQAAAIKDNRQINRAISDNLFALSLLLGSVKGGACHDAPDLKWASTGRPVLNRVFGARFAPEMAPVRVVQITALVKSWQAFTCWLIDPDSRPDNLVSLAEVSGWNRHPPWEAMARPLDTPIPETARPEELTLARLEHPSQMAAWAENLLSESSPEYRAAFAGVFVELGCEAHLPWSFYMACLQGKPVASSMLFLHGGIAGLYWIGTRPEARRQGIATALTAHTLRQAQQAGATLAVLQASDMGQPIYRTLGFREYGKVEVLVLKR